jgi:uncharacterized protein
MVEPTKITEVKKMRRTTSWIIFWLILFCLYIPTTSFAESQIPAPPPDGYVLDTLDWLSGPQETEINTIVSKLDNDGLAEIAVVTLNDCGNDKQKFRNDLFRNWGIGHANDNDGLLILICWYNGNKETRSLEQEVGYGLEGTIPDLLTSKIATQYVGAALKTDISQDLITQSGGKAGEALVATVKAYDSIIRGNMPEELKNKNYSGIFILIILIIIIAIVFLIFLVSVLNISGGSYGGGYYSGSSRSGGGGSNSGSFGSFGGGSSGGGGSSTSI